ncbi:hypothetical protein DYBT9275_04436 [Dyadobacter sp. CECT 9275]|uniref:Oxygen sensor histidine kinase NreB n=1 Tax=Dyadobacter helix TaxID=2822344 RepID=A0A916JI29_9BACT|nr:7TM diverse intracellular signaling domain-containing protein [Dyadobacter sp. CECT 9275]CAG5009162.1 hypothetical protein DYBT9275_04436 [Dyadobacter sp. CECT 9275]
MHFVLNYYSLRLFFDGMLVMMLFYVLITYYWQRKRVLIFYALYIISMLVYMTLDDTFYYHFDNDSPKNIVDAYDFALGTSQYLSLYLYGQFAILFMDLRDNDPLCVRIIGAIAVLSVVSVAMDFYYFFVNNNIDHYIFERCKEVLRYVFAALGLAVIYRVLRLRTRVVSFFVLGTMCYITGMIVAIFLLKLDSWTARDISKPFSFPMIPTEIGMILETICFTIGISWINRRTEMEKFQYHEELIGQLRQNEEKQLKLQLIRNDIARDLHDEIGSDVSGIKLLSTVASRQIESEPQEARSTLKMIGDRANIIMSAMREIVWSLNSDPESEDTLSLRLMETTEYVFRPSNLTVHTDIPESIPLWSMLPHYRRDLLLIYKEALHNVVKHASAENVYIHVGISPDYLELSIKDDGVGFDSSLKQLGNGLKNIQQRTSKLNGEVRITSAPGQGTRLSIRFPVTTDIPVNNPAH